jgi:outer membrane receptor protein involved in Fe transport
MFPPTARQDIPWDRRQSGLRSLIVASSLAVAAGSFFATNAAMAQDATAEPADVEEVVVTGTRIVRDGYESPTPLTIIGSESLEMRSSTGNVADTLNTEPVFAISSTPESSSRGVSAGSQGLNTLNLRGLGGTRTLTLLDGQRSVPSLLSGEVDANNFPQQLISRVEVVTGGASAVYGSDAIAGVVNFILDKDFTGFSGEVSQGVTTYGDGRNYMVDLAGGFPFADGRGHVLLSGQTADSDGVQPGAGDRLWNRDGWGIMVNPNHTPDNGEPRLLVRPQVSLSVATHGGIIVSGPLRGTAFGEGGVPYQFNYGPITNDPWMQGGDWQASEIRHDRSGSLEPAVKRRNVFARASYDLTDDVNAFVQVSWADTLTHALTWPAFQAGNGPTILSGNPFIPENVQAQMDALGVASFQIGSMNYDLPTVENFAHRKTKRYVIGGDGTFNLFDSEWSWNAYYQRGETNSTTDAAGAISRAEYANAVDAVIGPNGSIICRVQLTNPEERCVPWNPLGTGVNGGITPGVSDQAALNYVTGTAHVRENLVQDVYSVSFTGETLDTWAGPISLALSLEHRSEEAEAIPDPNSGNWFTGNFQAFDASIDVTEASIETVIPLASEASWAETLDLNAAVRFTDYSQAGSVSTWKVGAIYAPTDAISFRSTMSQDIRAPNFLELFTNVNSGFRSAFDPFTNTIPQFFGRNRGNASLTPEQGDTFEIGAVFASEWLPGFRASVDYWNIEVSDAIGGANDDQVLLFCFNGQTQFCDNVIRDGNGVIIELIQTPFNLASRTVSGVDLEATYTMPANFLNSAGSLTFNGRGTMFLESEQDDGLGGGPIDTLGHGGQRLNGPPEWGAIAMVGYTTEALRMSLTARAQSSLVIDNRNIECTSNCPSPPGNGGDTIEDNDLPSSFYLDASIAYSFDVRGSQLETFFNVTNILNKDPGIVPQGPTDFTYVSPLSRGQAGYDLLGRVFRAGVRFRM